MTVAAALKGVELARTFGGAAPDVPLVECSTVPSMLARLEQTRLERPALTSYHAARRESSLSYGELLGRVDAVARSLRKAHKLEAGDRAATIASNSSEIVIFNLAALSIGVTLVPLPLAESVDVLRLVIRDCRPSLVVFNRELGPALAPLLRELRVPAESLEGLVERARSSRGRRVWDLDLPHVTRGVLLYTSGTTGRPKGVTLSQYNLSINAEGLVRAHDWRADSTHMCVLPLSHANAFGFSMIGSAYVGSHLVLHKAFPFLSAARVLAREQVSICSVTPSIIRALSRRFVAANELPAFHYFVSAAAPLPVAVVREFHDRTGIRIHHGYGLSECTNFATTLTHNTPADEYEQVMLDQPVPSVGTALYGGDVDVVDHEGASVGDGVCGEVVVRGHNVMLGYWGDDDATRRALGEGFLRTGDEGYCLRRDGKRHLFITGRLKEIIIRNGENVSPRQVEEELTPSFPAEDFAVVGFPSDIVGEEVGLYAVAHDTPGLRGAIVAAVARIPYSRRPKVVFIGNALVPRTSTGKIRRTQLAPLFAEYVHVHVPERQLCFATDQHQGYSDVVNWEE